ncbi:uncharacterized protein LOC131257980 isoform X2 [Magnolia sinica]|uniref:uncharacterized protein LOC131257980 isoform X2 n=1 Tax=Magnolia sinica TaxID=86752 RepID=UPI002657DBB3|nr:uncharacterized protein LOC131257980 isoform X2 [Magnolia sinica]
MSFVKASNFGSLSLFSISINPNSSKSRLSKRNVFLFSPISSLSSSPISFRTTQLRNPRVYADGAETSVSGRFLGEGGRGGGVSNEFEDLATDGPVFKNTLRLVECSMFAAVAGLVYFLSNSLAIENYFGCFFSLPIVISSMRWGVAAGRKTMVATTMLLLTLSGPVKASTYLLMHGLVGVAMGSLWRLGANWGLSIVLCTFVRALGAMGYVLISSFLIRENILALLLLNCVFFVFLLHVIYAVFLTKLGMRGSLRLPTWLEKAI